MKTRRPEFQFASVLISASVALIAPSLVLAADTCDAVFSPSASANRVVSTAAFFAAVEELESATTTLERQVASGAILQAARNLLIAHGYSTSEMDVDDYGVPWIEITSAPRGTKFYDIFQYAKSKNVKIIMGGVDSYGRYMHDVRTVRISGAHAALGRDITSTTVVHEMTHADLTMGMADGKSTLVDAEIVRPEGSTSFSEITRIPGYGHYLSLQELFTFSDDIEMLQKGVPSVETVISKRSRESILAGKKRDLSLIAQTVVESTARALDVLRDNSFNPKVHSISDPEHGSIIRVDVPFMSVTGAPAVFRIWLPELKEHTPHTLSDSDLTKALIRKITHMHRNAANFR